MIKTDASFWNPQNIIYDFYPELKYAKLSEIKKGDNNYDILLLGGSTLHHINKQSLQKKFSNKIKKPIRLYNVAMPGHTSLDSYYKYKHLSDKYFDLIIYYHGVNDLYANNCPLTVFREDYSHLWHYKEKNLFDKYKNHINLTTLPYVIEMLITKIDKKINPSEYIAPFDSSSLFNNILSEKQMNYGENIKSKKSFKKNLINILEIAKNRDEKILLGTFSYYIPRNYTLDKFVNKSLDYGLHSVPIEIWGRGACAKRGIDIHNTIIEEAAMQYRNVMFVDQNDLLQKSRYYFNDVCHFTDKGYENFIDNIIETIEYK